MKIEIGKPAPDFTLYDSAKNKVTLSDYKGQKVVLLFFPLAFTGVCTKELCSVRDNMAFYNTADAVVLGISVDAPATLARFKEEQKLDFLLLSDFNKEASTMYETIYDSFMGWMKGVSRRSAFVIDSEGVLQYAEILANAGDLPNFEAIESVLKTLA